MMGLTETVIPAPLKLGVLPSVPQGSAASNSGDANQNSERALATVKEVASESRRNTAAKDAAMQKLTLLKTELNHLMMFGGDPKTRAREAAQIAKQIGATAKDYAQAGGDSADAVAATPSNASTGIAAAAADVSGGASASIQAVPSTPAVEWRTGTLLPTATVAIAKTPPGVATVKASNQPAASSSKTTDQAFMSEARLLVRRANAIVESALEEERHPKATGETESEGSKALHAVDNAAFALGLGGSHAKEPSPGYGASAQFLKASSAPTVALTA